MIIVIRTITYLPLGFTTFVYSFPVKKNARKVTRNEIIVKLDICHKTFLLDMV
jgi:hypothetical protein